MDSFSYRLQAFNFTEKGFYPRSFPVNFAEIISTDFSLNAFRRLLLKKPSSFQTWLEF